MYFCIEFCIESTEHYMKCVSCRNRFIGTYSLLDALAALRYLFSKVSAWSIGALIGPLYEVQSKHYGLKYLPNEAAWSVNVRNDKC